VADVPKPATRKRARDEEIVAVVVKVILDEGTVSSQKLLAHLVNRALKKRGLRVTGERVRVLAVRSGLVGVTMRTRIDGATPELERCPVCHSRLRRTANKTLTGATTQTGYRCTRCPYWTGRELRVPMHYVFQSRVTRTEKGQVTFAQSQRDD
jgi:uncharacterized protein with PIN domain